MMKRYYPILLGVLFFARGPFGHSQCLETWIDPLDGIGDIEAIILDEGELFVGRPDYTSPKGEGGEVVVLVSQAGRWVVNQRLRAGDTSWDDHFGASISVSGEFLVVGAPNHGERGAVYVFRRSTSGWVGIQKLTPNGELYSQFGHSVAIFKDQLLVGTRSSTGVADVYRQAGSTWLFDQRIDSPAGEDFSFANVVALGRNFAALSSTRNELVHVYKSSTRPWKYYGSLGPEERGGGSFGVSMAMDGDFIVVGAPWDDSKGSGFVSVYKHVHDHFALLDTLRGSDSNQRHWFGYSIGLAGDTMVVGAPKHRAQGVLGAAYVFDRTGEDWTETALIENTGDAPLQFGWRVDASFDLLAITITESVSLWSRLGPTAQAHEYGDGWPGLLGIPHIVPFGLPVMGRSIDLFIENSSASQGMCLVLAGHSALDDETHLGGNLLVSPTITFNLTLPAEGRLIRVDLPAECEFLGSDLFFQALILDAHASHGVAFTPGLQFVIGHAEGV